jgi:ATP/maltotriose-dependent transcriptional regulator MalT
VAGPQSAQVARARLTDRLTAARVALVEAPSGYGKSVLASQLRQALGIATAYVPIGPPDRDPAVLVASLRRALAGARLSDLLAATGAAEPAAWIERLLDALAETGDPVLLVLDDAHHLQGATVAELLVRLARGASCTSPGSPKPPTRTSCAPGRSIAPPRARPRAPARRILCARSRPSARAT